MRLAAVLCLLSYSDNKYRLDTGTAHGLDTSIQEKLKQTPFLLKAFINFFTQTLLQVMDILKNNNLKLNGSYLRQFVFFGIVYIFYIKGQNQTGLIYILTWTRWDREPTLYIGLGQEPFNKRNCSFQNCFITNNKSFFDNVLDFHALLFNVVDLFESSIEMPKKRCHNQTYVLVSTEPAAVYPISEIRYPVLLFNFTWTYKLSSDIVHPYIVIKNKYGEVIGPRKYMHWMHSKDMAPIGEEVKSKLRSKTVAAAWISSNCGAMSGARIRFVRKLQNELETYGQRLDIYGNCGDMVCEKIQMEKNGLISTCAHKIEADYYFYLAFENSFGEDYVSEKLLHALNHFAVPVVYGGANYSRFMPNGIYLNARWLGLQKLAKKMNDIIYDPQRYYDFFKWHGLYSFHNIDEELQSDGVCGFCALLNNNLQNSRRFLHKTNISKFWNILHILGNDRYWK